MISVGSYSIVHNTIAYAVNTVVVSSQGDSDANHNFLDSFSFLNGAKTPATAATSVIITDTAATALKFLDTEEDKLKDVKEPVRDQAANDNVLVQVGVP